MKICISSLRQRIHWDSEVSCIQDAFFKALKSFFDHSEHEPLFHNVSWTQQKPERNEDALRAADAVIVMTSGEWTWSTNAVPQTWVTSYDEKNIPALKAMHNRHVIVLTMDRADNLETLRKSLFKNAKFASEHIISECDFPQTIQSLRFNSFRKFHNRTDKKDLDFSYWGSPKRVLPGGGKSGDARYDILRDVMTRDGVRSLLIGNTFGKKRQEKGFDSDMKNSIPHLARGRLTCCFQWPGHGQYLTARYHEAMAMCIIPLVHSGYDVRNEFHALPWQRIRTANDIMRRIEDCRDPAMFEKRLVEVHDNYTKHAPHDKAQLKAFSCRLNRILELVSQ